VKEIMKRILADRALQFYVFATLTVLLPVLVLSSLGIAYLWREDWLLWFGLGIFILASIATILRLLIWRDKEKQSDEFLEQEIEHLPAVPDWSENDNRVWELSLKNITDLELVDRDWSKIWDAMQQQLSFVAKEYHDHDQNAQFAFTVPEFLLMLETWSREYRGQVLENVPLVQEIRISTFMTRSQEINKWKNFYDRNKTLIDVVRAVASKGVSIPGSLASLLTSEFGGRLTDHMQRNMKQLLFEQVSQVAIDLYSGRLKLSDQELARYRKGRKESELIEVNPLTIMLVGQVNAGKSSLINALSDQCVAEADLLPATDGFAKYRLDLTEDLEIYLVDSPGLDGLGKVSTSLLEQATRSDLLLWVSQATQQAKALDKSLIDQWDAYFDKELGRKKPPILLVTTHNDMLPPISDWDPPYDLEDVENPKVKSMLGALAYTGNALGLEKNSPAVAIALPHGKIYNVNILKEVLASVSHEARAAQLNRERLDADNSSPVVFRGLKQAGGALKLGWDIVFR
jgi:uncharacterized protein